MACRVLIIDDEPAMLENIERILRTEHYECRTLSEPLRFREEAAAWAPDVVVSDIRMPDADGMTLLVASLADAPERPVILTTAYASIASAIQAIREGAFDYITKPFTAEQLLISVDRACRFRKLTVENQTLRERAAQSDTLAKILGSSVVMKRLVAEIQRVAPTEASVLITGESGTGKELVARSIHELSARRERPFITVDCTALPEGLLESELFGHSRGAFTGAVQRREGLLVHAQGGTVFLDEIAELPPALQAKLLRVLEQRQVRPLGEARTIPLDLRIIAATHRDLAAAVRGGAFREDLYYRLEVVPLAVPPLRSRDGDLMILTTAFASEFALSLGRPVPRIVPDAWQVLSRHSWPGNVRELRNLVQRLVIMDTTGIIAAAQLPASLRGERPVRSERSREDGLVYRRAEARATREFRAMYVRQLLETHGGNVSQAARAAGVSRRTVHRWLAELHLDGAEEVT
ncbi:MAG: sigma-54 dependent transcriptional regulator [Gemmatimonadota bacterium]